jgi:glyoxylase-like metal-dependent hydrolase (beta-lactamase superfamily II)
VAAAEITFWESPDFTRVDMAPGFPDALRSTTKRFAKEYRSQLRMFDEACEVAPGVVVRRTGGHTPGHSVVRLASSGERLTFAGGAVFAVGFDHPDWHNGFEHGPDEAARVRIRLLTELAATGEQLVATHLPFPSSAGWRSRATPSAGYRPSGTTDHVSGQDRTGRAAVKAVPGLSHSHHPENDRTTRRAERP